MAGNSFKAIEETPTLDYDFAPWGPAGTITEPSHEMINDFRKSMAALIEGIEGLAGQIGDAETKRSAAESIRLMAAFLSHDDSAEHRQILGMLSALTGISNDVLDALPGRIQQAFMAWMVGTFLQQSSTLGIANSLGTES